MGQRRLGRHLRTHRRKAGTLMTVPDLEDDGDASAFIATTGMDFGGEAAPRAAQSLCGVATVFLTPPRRADGRARSWHRQRGGVSGESPPPGGVPRAGARARA